MKQVCNNKHVGCPYRCRRPKDHKGLHWYKLRRGLRVIWKKPSIVPQTRKFLDTK